MRNKLLEHLYGAFNQDPDAATALVISHAQGVSWSIAKRRLIVKTESGALLADLSLASGTLAQLGSALALAGVTVSSLNPAMGSLHPSVLLEGAGIESRSNGNSLRGHRSILWALLSSYAAELEDVAERVPLALDQAYLDTVSGEWLDFWGDYFGVFRHDGQNDTAYLVTIIRETLRPRSNRYAIENAVFDATGKAVNIEEPWRKIFLLDSSKLSSEHKFKDGSTIGSHLIQPTAREALDWASVLKVVHRNRAAGVLVLPPMVQTGAVVTASIGVELKAAMTRAHADFLLYDDVLPLGSMYLDGDGAILNHELRYRRTNGWFSHANEGGIAQPTFHMLHLKQYTMHSSGLKYPSQDWAGVGTWATSETWDSFTVVIDSSHTRVA